MAERRGPHVAVAGSGVLGLMCAWRLAQAGARVALYEAAPDRPNASIVAAGMIAPALECGAEPAMHAVAQPLLAARHAWTRVARELGVPLEAVGAVHMAPAEALHEREALLRSLGFATEPFGPADAGADGALPLFTREDAVISANQTLAALRRSAMRAGVTLYRGKVEPGWGGWTVAGEPITADALVLATGAQGRTAGLAPELVRLSPIKGQLLRWDNPNGARGPILRTPGMYLVTAGDAIIVGATMEPGRDDLQEDAGLVMPLYEEALTMAPKLAELEPPTHLVGVRADTPDGLPMAGPSAAAGVFLATGARRNGWLWAPPIAAIVTAQVMGLPLGALAPLAERLHPGRFGATGGTDLA